MSIQFDENDKQSEERKTVIDVKFSTLNDSSITESYSSIVHDDDEMKKDISTKMVEKSILPNHNNLRWNEKMMYVDFIFFFFF